MKPIIKNTIEIEAMREGGKMLAVVLSKVIQATMPGLTTKEIALVAKKEINALGAKPAFLDYSGFSDVICISVNDEVVHGLPGEYVIKDGDVVGFDFGVLYKGMYTDAARTIIVGSSNKLKQKLLNVTKEALIKGISRAKVGNHVGDISYCVQNVLENEGLGVVRDLVGHGVGKSLHEKPDIPNFGKKGTGIRLEAGMTLAIEPMSTVGSYQVYTASDGWAVLTRDGSLSAHFEETVLITENGPEILTKN